MTICDCRFGTVKLVLVAALGVGSTSVVFGASTMIFELGLGGSNHGVVCPFSSPLPLFTGDNPADGQNFNIGQAITWSVKVSATGTHTVNGTAYPIRGVANFVFDLELHKDTADGPLQIATFHSTVNNGMGGCPAKAAAFAFTMDPLATGPARVIDPQTGTMLDGPALDFYMYPTDLNDGRLLGMGAGYRQWARTGGIGSCIAGLGRDTGQVGDPVYGVLGRGPICEGQISGLPAGTYVLKLIPKGGNNVLRGDVDLSLSQPAFAVAANQTAGDTILFNVISGGCNTPRMDTNGDLHVDATDFDMFSTCYNGPTNLVSGDCLCVDVNDDMFVDANDFDVFSACYNGPTNPPGC